ncbi:MAG: S9 family peptidase [Bacteroidales bacterium]|nr:S9 family peptidase [Bacteroidales bacterium]
MKRFLIIAAAALASISAWAQKPAIDHSVYDGWKSIVRPVDQMDKDWVIYGISPQEGDGVIKFYNTRTGVEYTVDRGVTGRISVDSKRAVFKVNPEFRQTRQAKIDKKKPDQMPKDSLAVIDLTNGNVTKYPNLKSFKVAGELVDYVVFTENVAAPAPPKPEPGKEPKGEKEKPAKPEKKDNAPDTKDNLYVLNIKTLEIDTLKCVENCFLKDDGLGMAYVTKPSKKDSTVEHGIFLYDFASKQSTPVLTGDKKATFGSAYFNDKGDKMAFYANLDTAKEASKLTDIWLYENGSARKLVSRDGNGLRKGWKISDKPGIGFHGGDRYITFGTCPIPREKDTTLVEFEQPKLDIWVWNEDYVQTIQKNRVNSTKAQTFLAKADLAGDGTIIQLADKEIPNIGLRDPNSQESIIVFTDKPYRMEQVWSDLRYYDIYKISLKDGSRTLLKKNVSYTALSTSPDGAYTVYYDNAKQNWYLYTLASGEERDLTGALDVVFYDVEDDHPSQKPICGSATWFDDSKHFLLKDKYDLWQFDATGKEAPRRITEGRENKVIYSLYNPYFTTRKSMAKGTTLEMGRPMYFTTFNRTTKENGYAMLDVTKKKARMQQLVEGPYAYSALTINNSGKKPIYTYTKGNFETGNDVWSTTDQFKTEKQLCESNPQQKNYNWGTVELVSWTTDDGIRAEGLLFKPEDFNPAKKYPVIIYFYEKNSDGLYNVRTPAPSASTVNIPYFVSNGYICFIPDIYYTDGHPGKSALKAILPACDMLCENPWIDGDNMAIQGQSWGGYQVAYMITQTNRFKAAGAGAPVSNMTSAYGGIRWESGMPRTGQYEHGQSRIGKNLWDGMDLYIENSPLFFVPNVTTPVLIMHNDADGAVPWWQGIEFFNALRRCGKQAWMLQYNDEAHNLKERRNRKDLSIRLAQFFDHFLKGAPAPIWMTKGVPAELKGIEYGYGYEVNDTDNQ